MWKILRLVILLSLLHGMWTYKTYNPYTDIITYLPEEDTAGATFAY